jgi:GNAT superfamily N-acetyltransferase
MHSVRRAVSTDAAAIGALVQSFVADSLLDPKSEEAERFYGTLTPTAVANFMALSNCFYAVAEVNREVCGMIMVRDANYVVQFFVRAEQQGKGVGGGLWRFALANAVAAGGSGEFTVRSSVAAEAVYRRFGFQPIGPVQMQQGFRFVPMRRDGESAT